MTSQTPCHRIYLLIGWRERSEQARQAAWRFRLGDTRTGELANALPRRLKFEGDSPINLE